MNKKRKSVIANNEISEIRTYSLGGYNQKVLIDGSKRSNPILIFLHGGPGSPIPFCEGCRGMFPEITKKVTMVYWDQLGCGINNYPIDDSFTIDKFVDMTTDLIKNIKNDFTDVPINIFAVSWGSILAAKAAESIPELINKIVVYGQALKQLAFSKDAFSALENSNMPKRHRLKLAEIKKSSYHSLEDLKVIMKYIRKYIEGYQSKSNDKLPIKNIIKELLTSPDYSFRDFKAIIINGYLKNKSLLTELMNIDISTTLNSINIPYLIIQGDKDILTSTKLISEFAKTSKNNNIILKTVKGSGHIPNKNAMDFIINSGFEFFVK